MRKDDEYIGAKCILSAYKTEKQEALYYLTI